MRITRTLVAALMLGGCSTAVELTPTRLDAATRSPIRESRAAVEADGQTDEPLRTEMDLSGKPGRKARFIGHGRADLSVGAFTDSDLDAEYTSVWGIAVSMGVFLNDHISVGGLIDWSIANGEGEREVLNNRKVEVDLTMERLTFAPMIWFHSTPPEATTTKLRPDLVVGVGPAVVWAMEEATWDSWLFIDNKDDDSDVGVGFVAEASVEVPIHEQVTIALGGRYISAELNDFDVNGASISGFLGLGFRF